MNKKIKVAVGMSGGVDSGVAAALLVEKGYQVIGFHCHFWSEADEPGFVDLLAQRWENKCCSTESLEAARQTAYQLEIPFYTIDFRKDFKKHVVAYFIGEYKRGRTPNPCVMCNKFIKFGKLLDYARSLGCDYLATGHYAQVERAKGRSGIGTLRSRNGGIGEHEEETYHLLKGIDETKDQSYFLWTLTQEQLKQILFPIGNLTKKKVRKIAAEKKLPVAKRPESFEICFVPGKDYRDFMRRNAPGAIRPGPVLNTQGEIIGEHEGLPLYTIGQRHSFTVKQNKFASRQAKDEKQKNGIESKGYIPPLYVVGIDVKKNALIVGRGAESERKEFEVEEMGWVSPSLLCHPEDPEHPGDEGSSLDRGGFFANAQNDATCVTIKCEVRIRHQGELMKAIIGIQKTEVTLRLATRALLDFARSLRQGLRFAPRKQNGKSARVILNEPVRGITPGQSAVFYRGEEVLGGGIIKS